MQERKSIQKITKMYPTQGSRPVVVLCDDFNEYICKYDRNTDYLFNEFIAVRFAELWDIKVADIALVQVEREHVDIEKFRNLNYTLFEKHCFGAKYVDDTIDINQTTISLFEKKGFRSQIVSKDDFLKIALFDIWLANDDRHTNNYNLLLKSEGSSLKWFYAIDHSFIFNTSSLQRGLYEIDEYSTILNSDIAKMLYGKNNKLNKIVDNIVNNSYLCIQNCEEKINCILDEVPDSWEIDVGEKKRLLKEHLFSEEWKLKVETTFRSYIQLFI